MSSPLCLAPMCDRPAHAGFLCGSCVSTLRKDLESVTDLLADLEVTVCRQDKLSDPSGRSTDERPLPLRLGPVEARDTLTATLEAWARHVAGRRGAGIGLYGAAVSARYLRLHLNEVASDEQAGQLADEIGFAVITSRRAVDKPLQHVYLGPCMNELNEHERKARPGAEFCSHDLYAHPRAVEVVCEAEGCGAMWGVAELREWLLGEAEDQLRTATELSRALPDLLRMHITAATIRGWARYGKITQHPPVPGSDRPKDPTYRVGDVIDQARKDAERDAERQFRRSKTVVKVA